MPALACSPQIISFHPVISPHSPVQAHSSSILDAASQLAAIACAICESNADSLPSSLSSSSHAANPCSECSRLQAAWGIPPGRGNGGAGVGSSRSSINTNELQEESQHPAAAMIQRLRAVQRQLEVVAKNQVELQAGTQRSGTAAAQAGAAGETAAAEGCCACTGMGRGTQRVATEVMAAWEEAAGLRHEMVGSEDAMLAASWRGGQGGGGSEGERDESGGRRRRLGGSDDGGDSATPPTAEISSAAPELKHRDAAAAADGGGGGGGVADTARLETASEVDADTSAAGEEHVPMWQRLEAMRVPQPPHLQDCRLQAELTR